MSEEHREQRERRLSTADLAAAGRGTAHEQREERTSPHEEPSAVETVPLFEADVAGEYRDRWMDIQTEFVDDPRVAVQEADELVAEVIRHIADNFSMERGALEEQWNRGAEVSTEDLRVALQRYRSFFHRLLSL